MASRGHHIVRRKPKLLVLDQFLNSPELSAIVKVDGIYILQPSQGFAINHEPLPLPFKQYMAFIKATLLEHPQAMQCRWTSLSDGGTIKNYSVEIVPTGSTLKKKYYMDKNQDWKVDTENKKQMFQIENVCYGLQGVFGDVAAYCW